MFEYSLSAYCFNPLLHSNDLTIKSVMRFARSVGFGALEMLDMYWRDDSPRARQAETLALDAAAESMSISCYTVHNDLGLFDERPHRELVDRMLGDVDLAVALGAPVMRVESTWGPRDGKEDPGFEAYLPPVATGLREVARKAAEHGIQVGLENHGRYVGSSERVMAIIEAVAEDNFGACLDIGNFLCVDEDPASAVTLLAPTAKHVHMKDFHLFAEDPPPASFQTNGGLFLQGAILGEGIVEIDRCLGIIADAGYKGALSLEFEGVENLFYAVAKGYERLVESAGRLPRRK